MARRTKRLWTDEEKRSICFQTMAADVSVAQVARRYAMNANMIFKWLRDPRYAPDPDAVEDPGDDAPCFLPVEIVDRPRNDDTAAASDSAPVQSAIEIDIAGGQGACLFSKRLEKGRFVWPSAKEGKIALRFFFLHTHLILIRENARKL